MAKWNIKFSDRLAKEAEEWIAAHGLIDYEGATVKVFLEFLGVSDNTYYRWRKKYPSLIEAIERGKEIYRLAKAAKLEKSLFKAAEGGFVEEETETTEYVPASRQRADGDETQAPPTIRRMTRTKSKKWVKPDVGAAIFLLTNLEPDKYQNRQRADVSIKKDKEAEMTVEEIQAELERLEKLDK